MEIKKPILICLFLLIVGFATVLIFIISKQYEIEKLAVDLKENTFQKALFSVETNYAAHKLMRQYLLQSYEANVLLAAEEETRNELIRELNANTTLLRGLSQPYDFGAIQILQNQLTSLLTIGDNMVDHVQAGNHKKNRELRKEFRKTQDRFEQATYSLKFLEVKALNQAISKITSTLQILRRIIIITLILGTGLTIVIAIIFTNYMNKRIVEFEMLQDQHRRGEKIAGIMRLVVSINHELNSPLTAMYVACQKLNELVEDKLLVKYINIANKAANSIRDTVYSLREITDPIEVDYTQGISMYDIKNKEKKKDPPLKEDKDITP
ncbi:MAG: hypothetical protein HRT90_10875 [Candidatus Margulisbacteria bacterium]|nr:hypothetical protein [Candidatus Margulisiibacteriota bacterium]